MTDRNNVLREVWRKINSMIIPGPLDGNGCDRLAQRNGVILAANAILALMQEDAVADPLRQAATHLCAFDWESATSPNGADLNARILALRAELDR